ncbi:TetR/AcrR family transcriptional regulator [Loigolactobacillus jiayinensis]|uniref:TetR/AcrR family transcriptional regulator n=1 Tax=Loigolactobacillus jiayinensis TaxID=2486016 RepID=A0ABW1RFR1_9LACO|nr:TetR/AcrR family transcriptional regulator [Loigolactobacillus jiayinensis]
MGLRERKKALKRQEIVAVAMHLFDEKGFDKVTVAEIAKQASIAPKTLFTYFKSKDDIMFNNETTLLSGVRHLIQQQTSVANLWPAFHQFTETLPTDETTTNLMLITRELMANVIRNPELSNRLLQMWATYEAGIQAALIDQRLTDSLTAQVLAHQMVLVLEIMFKEELPADLWVTRVTRVFNATSQVASLTNEVDMTM